MTTAAGGDRFPAQWALDLLEHDPRFQHGFMYNYFNEFLYTGCAASLPMAYNRYKCRPLLKGWPVTVLCALGGLAIAIVGGRIRDHYASERDETLRQYIRLHPELFPEPKRVKIGDVFEPWLPVR